MLAGVIGQAWEFDVGSDVSTNDFGISHLDVCIRFPVIDNDNNLLSFHILMVTLFDEFHSGELLLNLFAKVLDVLCPQWKHKIIGSLTDGAPKMKGCHSGFKTHLSNVALGQAFY